MGDADAPNDGEIKMVMVVIRPDRLSDVKITLTEIGAPSLTVTGVSDRGSQPAKKSQWYGEECTVDLYQKVKVECVVADVPADDAVSATADATQTGERDNEKVFILFIKSAVQARTGKTGRGAV